MGLRAEVLYIDALMKRIFIGSIALATVLIATACSLAPRRDEGEGYSKLATLKEQRPHGMVLIPRGHITMGTDSLEEAWGVPANRQSVSVESFWMDRHEVTNAQYRAFVHYVRDSILRERMASPQYGGDERYKITEDKDGEPIKPRLDWSVSLPTFGKASDEELRVLNSLYYTNAMTGERHLDPKQLLYRYEVYDYKAATLAMARLRRQSGGATSTASPSPEFVEKDTAYIDASGRVIRERLRRAVRSEADFVHTYIVAIHPDEEVWLTDWQGAENDTYHKYYFQHPGYDNYPVVGVSWEQATAYCVWRTEEERRAERAPRGIATEAYRLPTEAEFEYAARSGQDKNVYPWSSAHLGSDDCLCGNFKPADGNYTADKHLITAPVGSYAPSEYGLYDMGGNVAEWTSTDWSPVGLSGVGDINPNLKQNGARGGAKVVKGGSWKDVARYVRAGSRASEEAKKGRSYIGFRCVRSRLPL